MCGFTFIHSQSSTTHIIDNLDRRGPDDRCYLSYQDDTVLMGSNDSSELQYFTDNNVHVICNGEIFNWKKIVTKYNLQMKSSCDCEGILRLYQHLAEIHEQDFKTIGIELSNELDGEFAFVIYIQEHNTTIASRDPYGVRLLFYGVNDECYSFSSEIKNIQDIFLDIERFEPGNIMINGKECHEYTNPHDIKKMKSDIYTRSQDEEDIQKMLNTTLKEAVSKRLSDHEEICCLLSGDFGSSLVAGLVSQHFEPYSLKTYSIGLKGSNDLEYAKKVADHIKSTHTSIELSEQEFSDAIPAVIKTIESYNRVTVKASIGNYLVSKYIKEKSDCKVVFNGDYIDEVCGGYKYMAFSEGDRDFIFECLHLVESIQSFDSLRIDKCVLSQGLKAQVPFADKDFVRLYMSIPSVMKTTDKYLLRKAFEEDNIIPHDVLWRKEEPFSSKDQPWHSIGKLIGYN